MGRKTLKPSKKDIKAYRFTRKYDRFWAIVLAIDDQTAEQCLLEDSPISKEDLRKRKIRKEIIHPSKRVRYQFSGGLVPISVIIHIVKFFPRTILDSNDSFEEIQEISKRTIIKTPEN